MSFRLPCALRHGPRTLLTPQRRRGGDPAGPGARADGAGQHLVASAAVADQARRVYTYDAPWHRGRDVADPHPISTERFVSDLGDAVGALGRPCRPGRPLDGRAALVVLWPRSGPTCVSALVVEDMAPDFRGAPPGRGSRGCTHSPAEFDSAQRGVRRVRAGGRPVHFLEAFDRTATGWRLHGHTRHWIEIAAEWGTRDYWTAVEGGARSRACSSRRATPSRLQGRCAKWMKPATGQRIYTCPAPVI